MPAALALFASLLWGSADFLGGHLSRRLPARQVVALSQGTSLVVIAAWAAVVRPPVAAYLWWGIGAGVVGGTAVAAFYRALAVGRMGVVAPIAGTGAVIPVVVGLSGGERPSAVQLTGIALAVVGVVLASHLDVRAGGVNRRSVLLALVAAAGFGSVLVFLDRGSAHDVVGTLCTTRLAGVAVTGGALLVHRMPWPRHRDLGLISLTGLADLVAITAYGVATRSSLLAVVAVLASLYPVMTAVLARQVYGERLVRSQLAGVAAAMTGVLLLTAG